MCCYFLCFLSYQISYIYLAKEVSTVLNLSWKEIIMAFLGKLKLHKEFYSLVAISFELLDNDMVLYVDQLRQINYDTQVRFCVCWI